MEEKIKIIIADDHPIFRKGLIQVISDEENVEIIGEADEGMKALKLINDLTPDIALLDIDMPKMNGLQILKDPSLDKNKTKIIFLTNYKEEDMFNEAIEHGTMGYVLKENAISDILDCIISVNQNRHYISPVLSSYLINRSERIKEIENSNSLLKNLTRAERNILKMIAQEMTSKEIADLLFISNRTVDNHRTTINNKLNLRGSHSLLKFAIENKSLL